MGREFLKEAGMNLIELLAMRGLKDKRRVKLVRHQDSRHRGVVQEMYKTGEIEVYQAYQRKPIFKNIDWVVSFLGLEGSLSLLIGVYRNAGCRSAAEVPLPTSCKHPEMHDGAGQEGFYHYSLEKVAGFEDLEGRLVVDWGGSTLSWHQKLTPKEVVEILPRGYVSEFPGYEDILLDFFDLKKLFENPRTNRLWEQKLSAVAGIYLITDSKTGALYVGSASGKGGIWARWRTYAATGHGNNKELIKLLAENPERVNDFRFSILRTLSTSLTQREVVAYEGRYKEKLGARAFGLNLN